MITNEMFLECFVVELVFIMPIYTQFLLRIFIGPLLEFSLLRKGFKSLL